MIQLKNATAYTVHEVAQILHKTEYAVRLNIKNGELKAHKVSGTYYILDEWLKEYVVGDETTEEARRCSTTSLRTTTKKS